MPAQSSRLFLRMVPLVIFCLGSLVLINPRYHGPFHVVIGWFIGVMFTQATVAAVWSAFGPGPLGVRIAVSLAWVPWFGGPAVARRIATA